MKYKQNKNKKRKIFGTVISVALIIIFAVAAYLINKNTHINKIQQREGIFYEKAIVTKVLKNDLDFHEETGFLVGRQTLEVLITTGELKGQTLTANNDVTYTNNHLSEAGTKLIVQISVSGDLTVASVDTYDRMDSLIIVVIIFSAVLCIVGGKKGVKALMALVFTFVSIFFIFIPLIYQGISPILASIVLAIGATFVTMMLIDGWNAKTVSAIIGTVICVIIAGALAMTFGSMAKISDYTLDASDTLILISRYNKFKIEGLLFSSILIASLGAIMDVSISVASTINEVYENNPVASKKALFKSGLNVGRDMIGTMSNTLILAFTGGYLVSIVLLTAYDITLYEIFSSPSVVTEIIQGIAGSIGIFLSVPIVALIASRLIVLKTSLNPVKLIQNALRKK